MSDRDAQQLIDSLAERLYDAHQDWRLDREPGTAWPRWFALREERKGPYRRAAQQMIEAARDDREVIGVANLLGEALCTDGGHHKQWYLEQIAERLGIVVPGEEQREPGIPP